MVILIVNTVMELVLQKVIYPKQVQSKKGRFAYLFERHWYAFERGKNDVVGRFTSFLSELGVFYLVLDRFGVHMTATKLGVITLIACCIIYIVGRIYIHIGWDSVRNLVNSERNPMVNDVYHRICKGKK